MSDPVRSRSAAVEIAIRVQPRARRTELAGRHGDEIKVRVAAPPVAGRANHALVEFLADRVGVARSRVRIVSGETSRSKRVLIEGVRSEDVRAALGVT